MPTNAESTDPRTQHPGIAALVRIGWIAAGFIAMVMTAMSIANLPPWSLTFRDYAFWGVAAITGLLRYIDVTRFGGETANGQPATAHDLRNYLIGLFVAASAAWVAVQSVDL